jgi:hypothetical protein
MVHTTSALAETDGPVAPAAGAAANGTAAKLSTETTAPSGIRRRTWRTPSVIHHKAGLIMLTHLPQHKIQPGPNTTGPVSTH